MSQVTMMGNPIKVIGNFPKQGEQVNGLTFTNKDLSDVTLADFAGKRKVLNIFPSIDTGVCATSVRTFNQRAAALNNAVVLCISADLPFAQALFAGLTARAVIVLDENNHVLHSELVSEIKNEPNYDAALAAL